MTEIKIKKKSPIWPWIVGVLILGAIIYFLIFANDSNDDVDDIDDATTTNTEQIMENDEMEENNSMNDMKDLRDVSEINAYTTYVSNPDMELDHEFTSTAISKLIAATRETADELDVDIDAHLSAANTLSNEITSDPESFKHANKIKDAADNISRALKTIQTEKFPQFNSQSMEIDKAVSNINVDVLTLEQKDAVKTFFTKSGNLLTSIQNNNGQEQ